MAVQHSSSLVENDSHPPLVTNAIPLYRSKRFLDSIIANLEDLDYPNLEILISDRHCHDDAIDILMEKYGGDGRFRFFKSRDELTWVAHFNFLLQHGAGKYFRWMPHDDRYPQCNLKEMTAYLEDHAETVIVWGPTQVMDFDGNPLWVQKEPKPAANPPWTFDISVLFNFDDYCNGAFKGLFRRDLVESRRLYLQPTHRLQYSERCWLFAMSLLGQFYFMPTFQYQKRIYSGSTHARWVPNIFNIFSQYRVMQRYLWRLSASLRRQLVGDLFLFVLTARKTVVALLPAESPEKRKRRINQLPLEFRQKLADWIRKLAGEPVAGGQG